MIRYVLCVFASLGIVLQSVAQQNYTIYGEIESYQGIDSVELYTFGDSGREVLNTAKVNHGSFVLKGVVDGVTQATINLKEVRGSETIYIGDGDVWVEMSPGFEKPNRVIGGFENSILKQFELVNKEFTDSMLYYGGLYAEADMDEQIEINEKLDSINTSLEGTIEKFIAAYPSSHAIINAISYRFDVMPLNKLENLLNSFSSELNGNASYKKLVSLYNNKKNESLLNKKAPAVVGKTEKGEEFSISELKGKLILLDFWASWCVPCRVGNKHLKPIYEAYKKHNFEIVSFSLDNDEVAWKNAIQKDELPWVQVSELREIGDSDVANNYHVKALPTLFLINEEGEVIAQNFDKNELVEILKQRGYE